ncbi:MAG: c-type cytochrome domain-containing protein, partial [Planctomyces sp.]
MLRLSVPLPCCPLPCCRLFSGLLACCLLCSDVFAGEDSDVRTLTQARQHGLAQSLLLTGAAPQATQSAPQEDHATFRELIAPVLQSCCVQCDGPDEEEGNIRIDTLNPDLLQGPDVSWWLEVSAVVSKHEMPPPGESEL